MNALSPAIARVVSRVLLVFSNLFMTYARYGHARDLRTAPLWATICLVAAAFRMFRGVRVHA